VLLLVAAAAAAASSSSSSSSSHLRHMRIGITDGRELQSMKVGSFILI
jgi:hypothetical protein